MARQSQVLVVDDEPDLGRLLVALLESEGYRSTLATSGAEALELVKRLKPAVVVLDLSLPDVDGLNVLHTIKTSKDGRKIPVIVASAYTGRLTSSDKALTHAVFEKPFDLDQFANSVAVAYLRREAPRVVESAPLGAPVRVLPAAVNS